jgi:hypothetical protein
MERIINIDGRDIPFKATAGTIRRYRAQFGRDLLQDFQRLQEAMSQSQTLTSEHLTVFENLAYTMAKQADPEIPATPDDWLDTFDMFSIYNVLPQLVQLFGVTLQASAELKKKA